MGYALQTVLASYAVILSVVGYCCFCATTEGDGPGARVTRLCCETLPAAADAAARRLPGGAWLLARGGRWYAYLVHERNPLLQSFYVIVIFGAYGFFVFAVRALASPARLLALSPPRPLAPSPRALSRSSRAPRGAAAFSRRARPRPTVR